MPSDLNTLAQSLPELYQPLYGQPALAGSAPARDCVDRLDVIVSALSGMPDTPLRILDVGCAQGYFSLGIADRLRGRALLTGIDGLAANIEVCNALREDLGLPVAFEQRDFDQELAKGLAHDSYDVVLLLSVVHHVAHRDGFDAAKAAIAGLAAKVPTAFLELAVREEGPEWSGSLPDDPSAFLESFAFVRELGRYKTHVSPVTRPMYFASNRYAHVNGRSYPFIEMRAYPHALDQGAHAGTRRYYLGQDVLVKRASLVGDTGARNRDEFRNERRLLSNEAAALSWFPKMLAYEETDAEIFLVRQHVGGSLLSDVLGSGMPVPAYALIEQLLGQLTDLEDRGLYHHDLRPWNVVVGKKEWSATLIDFGAIHSRPDPLVFDAFFALLYDVAASKLVNSAPAILRSRRTGEVFPEAWRWFVDSANELRGDALTFRALLALLRGGPNVAIAVATGQSVSPALFARLEQRFNAIVDHFGEQFLLYQDALSRSAAGIKKSVNEALAHEARARASYESLDSFARTLQASLAEATRYSRSMEEVLQRKDAYARELLDALHRAQDGAFGRSVSTEDTAAIRSSAEIEELRRMIEEAVQYNTSLLQTIASKDEYVTVLVRNGAEMERALAEARAARAVLASEVESGRAQVLQVPDVYLKNLQSLAATWGAHLAAHAENRQLSAALAAEVDLRGELSGRMAEIEERAAHVEQLLEDLRQRIVVLTSKLDKSRDHVRSLTADLKDATDELGQQRSRDAALREHWVVRWLDARLDRKRRGG